MNLNLPGNPTFLMLNVLNGEAIILVSYLLDINFQSVVYPKLVVVITRL